MYKQHFTVSTLVVVVLAIVGVFVRQLSGIIPRHNSNPIAAEPGDYMKQGASTRVRWHKNGPEPFSLARREGKPILFVVGAPWSRLARQADQDIFGRSEIASYINRNFVCVRVDGVEDPEWLTAFLPVSRLQHDFLIGFQIWVLDPEGQVLELIGRNVPMLRLNPSLTMDLMSQARDRFEASQAGEEGAPIPGAAQKNDVIAIRGGHSRLVPLFERYGEDLETLVHPKHGGLPERGLQQLHPNAWRFLLLTGKRSLLDRSVQPLLRSPLFDLLDGGFFRMSEDLAYRSVSFDKIAAQNAQMMSVLAHADALDPNPLYRYAAERTFDSLTSNFSVNGFIAACRAGDELATLRSKRSSFSPARLRRILDSEELDIAHEVLGLRTGENPQMVPYLRTGQAPSKAAEHVLAKLRTSTYEPTRTAGHAKLYVMGYVVARLLEVAVLWDDHSRLERALTYADKLERYRFGSDVLPSPGTSSTSETYLGDYLAYADAAIEDYIATGRVTSFERGLAILQSAVHQFSGEAAGEYDTRRPSTAGPLQPQNTVVPEITDEAMESSTATLIRLLLAYSRLTTDSALAEELHRRAFTAMSLFAGLTDGGGPEVAGYHCASLELVDDGYFLCSGPDAVRLTAHLRRKVPTRFSAPVLGPVRKDVQELGSGVFVIRRNQVQGPLTVAEAAALLRPTFQPR